MKNILSVSKLTFNLLIIAFILVCTSSSAQWIRRVDALQYRSDLSESIIYKSKLYTFLGFFDHDRHADSTSEVYDPATDTYTLLAPIPANASMTHEKIVLIDNTVWLIGGRVGQNPGPLTSAIWIYNITTNSWCRGPGLKDPATGQAILWAAGGAALLGRTLHIFGGFIINACHHDQSLYHLTLDVDSWLSDTTKTAVWNNSLTPLPKKRNHFSTIVFGGKIYAIGGQFDHDCGNQEEPFSHVYDPATDTWTELPLLPKARSHAEGGSFAIDGKIYIVGGQDENGASTDKVTIFDPDANNGTGSWKDDSSLTLPAKYEGGTSKIINSTFIYSHGGEGTSAKPRNKTYTRTIMRNPVYKFGFSSGCVKLNTDSGISAKGKNLLFTIDSSVSYLISSNTEWLTMTKNGAGIATPNGADIGITANTTGLAPGDYNGTITATDTEINPQFTNATFCVNLTIKGADLASKILEAETAGLSGVKVANNHPGFSGTGFVDYTHFSSDYIEWTINSPGTGSALLGLRYSNGTETDRPLQLSLNGIAANLNLSFPSTGTWANWATVSTACNLVKGVNTVRLTAIGYSGPNIDYLVYTANASALPEQRGAPGRSIIAKSPDLLKVYLSPNPVAGNARLVFNTSSSLPLTAEIIDMAGRPLKKIMLFNTGLTGFSFSVNDMCPGIYVIRVRQGSNLVARKFVIE